MGTGISRLNLLMSCGPFQPLGRRIDEMRKMGSTGLDHGTPSTKMLLNNNNNDHEDSGVSIDSGSGADACCQDINSNICSSAKKDIFMVVNSTKDKGKEKGSTLELEEDKGKGDNVYITNNEDEEEDEGGKSSDYEGLLWIRSPSFRDYCVDHSDDDNNSLKNVNGDKTNGEKRENQTEAADDADNKVCMIRQEPKTLTPVSKWKGEKRFRKVFSHRPSGMKNLLKVKNCHNPKVPHSGPGKPPGKSS